MYVRLSFVNDSTDLVNFVCVFVIIRTKFVWKESFNKSIEKVGNLYIIKENPIFLYIKKSTTYLKKHSMDFSTIFTNGLTEFRETFWCIYNTS